MVTETGERSSELRVNGVHVVRERTASRRRRRSRRGGACVRTLAPPPCRVRTLAPPPRRVRTLAPPPTPFALKRRVASVSSASVTRSDLDRSSEGEATSQQIAKDSAPCTHVKMHGSERRDDRDAARRKRKASKSRGGFCSETEFTAELE